jgi:hypothetical protein
MGQGLKGGYHVRAPVLAVIAVWFSVLMLPSPMLASDVLRDMRGQPIETRQDMLAWINAYRDDPRPDQLPEAVKTMSRLGLFRDTETAGVYLGFAAGVIGANQPRASNLITGMFPMRPADQIVIIRAITDSGLPEWRTLLNAFTERMPARHVTIRQYLEAKRKPLAQTPLDQSPAVIDAWWGVYFATGRYDPILRLLPALAWSDEKENLERLTIGSMAKWTLASNASRDKPLLDYLRDESFRQPSRIAGQLREIVAAAETFEVAKIRKAQVAKIETRKAKGPPRARGWAWWSEMASTALAVGCVVAGATGQAALGLPCIIGGAVSSAATTVLRREESLAR